MTFYLRNDVNLSSKMQVISRKTINFSLLASWGSTTKIAGSGSGSVGYRHGSGDAYQNVTDRVADPHWFYAVSDPAFFLSADPDPGSWSRVWWPKIEKYLQFFFGSKIAIYLSLGLHKGRPSYRKSLQPSKKEHPALQNMKILYFFYFCGTFLPSWIRIWIQQLKFMRIHAVPDPQPWSRINNTV